MQNTADEKPFETARQSLQEEDFLSAYRGVKIFRRPLRRRGVRVGLCLTAAAVSLSFIPSSMLLLGGVAWPVCTAAAALLLGAAFWIFQPSQEKESAAAIFESSALLRPEQQITFFRDRMTFESKYESFVQFWSETAACVETPAVFAFAGGREKSMIVIAKRSLEPGQAQRLSQFFQNEFTTRYLKTGR